MTKNIPDEVDPNNSQTWTNIGIWMYKTKKLKEAIYSFDKSLKIEPYNYDALLYKSRIFFIQEKIEESVACLDKILKKYPYADEILYLKGTRHAAWVGDIEMAIDCFEKAIEINPDRTMHSYWLAKVLTAYGKFEEALEVTNKLLERKSDSEPLRYCKIHILGNLGKFEEQIFECDLWLEKNPKDRGIMHVKANALANLKKFQDAVIWYDNAWRRAKIFYGLENKNRALEALSTGNVTNLPFTYHCNGKNFDFSIPYNKWDKKTKTWKIMHKGREGSL
jgi:tetratricopeptide (TPR) repeat protein